MLISGNRLSVRTRLCVCDRVGSTGVGTGHDISGHSVVCHECATLSCDQHWVGIGWRDGVADLQTIMFWTDGERGASVGRNVIDKAQLSASRCFGSGDILSASVQQRF